MRVNELPTALMRMLVKVTTPLAAATVIVPPRSVLSAFPPFSRAMVMVLV